MMNSRMGELTHKNQRGAVSIFIVVFSALFVTIITVSFVSLMIRGTQQAISADLSNSAYDAALSGVEDAKGLLLKYRQCLRNPSARADCAQIMSLFDTPACNMVKRSATNFLNNDDSEMLIESSSGSDVNSKALDQAYTCVKVAYTAEKKELQLREGESVLIPIESAGATYDRINISWFMKDSTSQQSLGPLELDTAAPLPATKNQWMPSDPSLTLPPILRTQWIQHSSSFNATDFDFDQNAPFEPEARANTKTVFLYPHAAGTNDTRFSLEDNRSATVAVVKDPTLVRCGGDYNDGQYACSVDIALPVPVNNTGARTAYLQLAALYNSTKVRISLLSGSTPVRVVAPTIDATGRANDLFRRVKVGVSFTGEYPRAGFDLGNLCKDFSVSDTPDGYTQGACDPNNP